jgi:hypothetical protein
VCLQFGFVIFWQKDAHKMLVKLTPGGSMSPRYVCDFYLLKIAKLLITQQPLKDREKIGTYLESSKFWKFFDVSLAKFENNQILLYKISHKFLVPIILGEQSSLGI